MPKSINLILLFTVLLYSSCSEVNNGTTENLFNLSKEVISLSEFESKIKDTIKSIKTDEKVMLDFDIDFNVRYAYQLYGYRPFWFSENGLKSFTKELPMQFFSLIDEGININDVYPGRYDSLIKVISRSKFDSKIPIDSIVRWDINFTKAYLTLAYRLMFGKVEMEAIDKDWNISNDSFFDGAVYLAIEAAKNKAKFPTFDNFRPKTTLYTNLQLAVKRWQILSTDPYYISLKKTVISPQFNDGVGIALIKKEIMNTNIDDENNKQTNENLIKTYQILRDIYPSGKFDGVTIAELSNTPEYYIRKLKINLERLRALPREFPSEYIWITSSQSVLKYRKARKTTCFNYRMRKNNELNCFYRAINHFKLFTNSTTNRNLSHNPLLVKDGKIEIDSLTVMIDPLSGLELHITQPGKLITSMLSNQNYAVLDHGNIGSEKSYATVKTNNGLPLYIVYLTAQLENNGNRIRYIKDLKNKDRLLDTYF